METVANAAEKFEKKVRGEVEVNIIGDKEMEGLNSHYRGKCRTTDVLSFAWTESVFGAGEKEELGQIFISYPQLKRQAKEQGVKDAEELARLLIHGLLHLVGYDHKEAEERKKMVFKEDKIIKYALSAVHKKF